MIGVSESSQQRCSFKGDGYIDTIFCAATIGFNKPAPEYFQFILSALEVPKSSIVMIRDSLEKDIHGALQQGIDGIWFNPGNQAVPKDIVALRSLTELSQF